MNTRIFHLILKKLQIAFNLPKYDAVRRALNKDTRVDLLPWTPGRYDKFHNAVKHALNFDSITLTGTVEEITKQLDQKYLTRFFGEIWKPRTDTHTFTGWQIVDVINKQNPKAVLDVGCGYNPFKGRINNLTGIDPYNNCADFMVDVLEFKVGPQSFDHIIVFGSLNFNSRDEIESRFKRVVELLAPGGTIYFRANTGIDWPNGPYVDIFHWTFEIAHELAVMNRLQLQTYKKDSHDRVYFVYSNHI